MLTKTRLEFGTLPRKFYSFIFAGFSVTALLLFYSSVNTTRLHPRPPKQTPGAEPSPFELIAANFTAHPLNGPDFKNQFGELGQRVQILTSWFQQTESSPQDPLRMLAENVTLQHFPFLRSPERPDDLTPVASLRNTYVTGTRGIVIPVGRKNFRFAVHLVLNIRYVLKSRLPIQIMYAGDDDLPPYARRGLRETEPDIEFIDVLTIFDTKSMGLGHDWAIKLFAVLASTFETVILLDADCVFLQMPEVMFEDEQYVKTGALFFHDRKIHQHSYQERHKWWKEQMKGQIPSATLNRSLVWTEDYAEEADSGVVVLDKGRLPIFMGLLHICWQNTKAVREAVTYKITYGDKESWWFGLELCRVPYSFEDHYASVLDSDSGFFGKGMDEICGFTIAHLDRKKVLLWYNGPMLKNKAVDKDEFGVPFRWMVDGNWRKGKSEGEFSCMKGGVADSLSQDQIAVVTESIALAQKADEEHNLI